MQVSYKGSWFTTIKNVVLTLRATYLFVCFCLLFDSVNSLATFLKLDPRGVVEDLGPQGNFFQLDIQPHCFSHRNFILIFETEFKTSTLENRTYRRKKK